MKKLLRKILAGNAKKMRNWPTLPRNFSATAGTKNLKWVPKLVKDCTLEICDMPYDFW